MVVTMRVAPFDKKIFSCCFLSILRSASASLDQWRLPCNLMGKKPPPPFTIFITTITSLPDHYYHLYHYPHHHHYCHCHHYPPQVDHVCMTEGNTKGHMCFCEEDDCNTAATKSPKILTILLALFLANQQWLVLNPLSWSEKRYLELLDRRKMFLRLIANLISCCHLVYEEVQ